MCNYKFNKFSQVLSNEINSNSIENILSARGFLIDIQENEGKKSLFLSDNSYFDSKANRDYKLRKNDIEFLKEICKKSNSLNVSIIENEHSAVRIDWNGYLDEKFVNILFDQKSIQIEVSPPYNPSNRFLNHIHSLKVPLSCLEPGVGILIKSLSAIGIGTWCACDGHGVREARIDFEGLIQAKWCEKIIKEINKKLNLKMNWVIENDTLTIKDSGELYDVDYFRELIDVGIELYKFREKYITMKKQLIQLIAKIDSDDQIIEKISNL